MPSAQDDYDAARLLLVLLDEDLDYLRQALQDTPDDARLAAAVAMRERMRIAYLALIEEARSRLDRDGRAHDS